MTDVIAAKPPHVDAPRKRAAKRERLPRIGDMRKQLRAISKSVLSTPVARTMMQALTHTATKNVMARASVIRERANKRMMTTDHVLGALEEVFADAPALRSACAKRMALAVEKYQLAYPGKGEEEEEQEASAEEQDEAAASATSGEEEEDEDEDDE